jgi:hypothetical protein
MTELPTSFIQQDILAPLELGSPQNSEFKTR